MKPENMIWAGFHLLLQSLFITIGVIIAFIVPSSESGEVSGEFQIDVSQVHHRSLSDEHLKCWLNFLELPHEDLIVSEDNVIALLEGNPAIAKLDFFENVAANDRVEFLSSRFSAVRDEDTTCGVSVTILDATDEDAGVLLDALNSVHQKKLDVIAANYVIPFKPFLIYKQNGALNPHDSDRRFSLESGALLASILLVAVWSICTPGEQRRLPVPVSFGQMLIVTLSFATVGASIGLVVNSWFNVEWESEANVHLRQFSVPRPPSEIEFSILAHQLGVKIKQPNPLSENMTGIFVDKVIHSKRVIDWRAFKHLKNDNDPDKPSTSPPAEELLRNHILSRLVIEDDSEASGIYTLRFRCGHHSDAVTFLACFISTCSDHCETQSVENVVKTNNGSNVPIRAIHLDKLSSPSDPIKVAGGSQSQIAFHGAFTGATCALILLSFVRVLSGNPPV